MKTNIKQPNNNAIALLIGLNIFVSILILINSSTNETNKNVAYANTVEEVEPTRKVSEESNNEEEILFNVESVTQATADVNTIPLYFSHSNEHGTFFTYTKTEKPSTWEQGYWYIDYNTLFLANINPTLLKHNDEVQGVFYPSEYGGDSFEIKEVLAMSQAYSYK